MICSPCSRYFPNTVAAAAVVIFTLMPTLPSSFWITCATSVRVACGALVLSSTSKPLGYPPDGQSGRLRRADLVSDYPDKTARGLYWQSSIFLFPDGGFWDVADDDA